MKPTSIISLIVSFLLVIAGLITCTIAKNMAEKNGKYLFSEESADGSIHAVDIADSDVAKIELIFKDAEVNIYGNAEKSKIEFVNFRENYYTLVTANRVMSFNEVPDLLSMVKFWENGFSFKGMRYFLDFKEEDDNAKKKIINLYLSDTKNLKQLNIIAEKCIFQIENLSCTADITITADELIFKSNEFHTSSALKINPDEEKPSQNAIVTLNSTSVKALSLNAEILEMNSTDFKFTGIANINCDSGIVNISTVKKISAQNLSLTTQKGVITVDELIQKSPYSNIIDDSQSNAVLTVVSEKADINIKSNNP